MSRGGDDSSTEALDAIAYLSRSANRVRLLDALSEEPFTRGELADRTPASRTTVDRIVNEFQDRGWAERSTEGRYVATVRGTQMMRRFRPLIESVEALQRLGDAIEWLPLEELSIGLEHFSDAVVWRPTTDPVETLEFMCDLVHGASRFRVLSDLVPPEPLEEVVADCIARGELTMDGVTTDEVLSYLGTRSERVDRWRTMIESGVDLRSHRGSIPCNLWVIDDTVLIKNSSPEPIDESYGVPIVSRDETVLGWANELIDEWEASATRVESTTLQEDAHVSPE